MASYSWCDGGLRFSYYPFIVLYHISTLVDLVLPVKLCTTLLPLLYKPGNEHKLPEINPHLQPEVL